MTEQRMVPAELLEEIWRDIRIHTDATCSSIGGGVLNDLRAIIDGPGVEPVGYIDAEQLRRWDVLRGTEFESPERCYMPFSKQPFKTDMTDCSLAVFLAAPSAPAPAETMRDAVRDAIAAALGDAYDCTRVWDAWNVGTMTRDDFVLVCDDESRLYEIADAAISAMLAAPQPPATAQPSVAGPTDKEK